MNALLNNRVFTAPTLWTAGEAEAATRGISTQQWVASGITIESSAVMPGDIYIHINEEDRSSLIEAFRKGAAVAVVSAVPTSLSMRLPYMIVEDTYRALYDLAAVARIKAMDMVSIAVTGSLGKSSLRAILSVALGRQGVTHTKQSDLFSTHLSLPLALANTPSSTRYGLYELGVTRFGEAFAFSKQCQPNIAVITNCHMPNHDNFSSLNDMMKEYSSLFEAMPSDSTAVLNADCPYYPDLVAAARTQGIKKIWSFGGGVNSHARLIDVVPFNGKQRMTFEILGERHHCLLPLYGSWMVYNTLAAMLVVAASGARIDYAIRQIEKMNTVAGRGKIAFLNFGQAQNPVKVIDETAHLCVTSLENAIDRLSNISVTKQKRKVLIVSDLPHLTDSHGDIAADMADLIEQANFDVVYGCGNWPSFSCFDKIFNHHAELSDEIINIIEPGDTVLIAGDKTSGFRHVLSKMKAIHLTHEGDHRKAINDMPVVLWGAKALAANDG